MNMRNVQILSGALLLLATPVGAMPGIGAKQPVAAEQLGGTILSVTPTIAYEAALLRVSGPDGYSLTKRIPVGTPITADLLTEGESGFVDTAGQAPAPRAFLQDGRYRYEIVLTAGDGTKRVHSGRFFAQNGALVSAEAKRGQFSDIRAELNTELSGPGSEGTTTNDYVSVVDAAADNNTVLYLFNTATGFDAWYVRNDGDDLQFGQAVSGLHMTIENSGQVGIGTGIPSAELDIVGSDGEIELTGNGQTWTIDGDNDGFYILADSATLPISLLEPVGIGTISPEADIHVTNVDSTGDTVFKIAHAPAGSWNLGMTPTGVFTFNKGGTGGQEATFRPRQDAAGPTFEVQGSVKATNVAFPSSRALKTGFEAMDTGLVLDKVTSLPVSSWRFKTDPEDMVRFGPMAEDFHSLFDVGDGKTITVLDVQGVTLAAIQGLNAELKAEVEAKDAEIDALKSRLAAIEEKLAALTP